MQKFGIEYVIFVVFIFAALIIELFKPNAVDTLTVFTAVAIGVMLLHSTIYDLSKMIKEQQNDILRDLDILRHQNSDKVVIRDSFDIKTKKYKDDLSLFHKFVNAKYPSTNAPKFTANAETTVLPKDPKLTTSVENYDFFREPPKAGAFDIKTPLKCKNCLKCSKNTVNYAYALVSENSKIRNITLKG